MSAGFSRSIATTCPRACRGKKIDVSFDHRRRRGGRIFRRLHRSSHPQLRGNHRRPGLWARRSAYLDRYRFEIPQSAGRQDQWRSSICGARQSQHERDEGRSDGFPARCIHVFQLMSMTVRYRSRAPRSGIFAISFPHRDRRELLDRTERDDRPATLGSATAARSRTTSRSMTASSWPTTCFAARAACSPTSTIRAPMSRARTNSGATPIGRGATIGANATIVCGHALGRYCFIGAGAVVTRDVRRFRADGGKSGAADWMDEPSRRAARQTI